MPQRLRATSTPGIMRPTARRTASRSSSSRKISTTDNNASTRMTIATVGAAKITRIEETYGHFFEAKKFFAEWRDEIVAEHMGWLAPAHYDPASGYLKLSIHSWLIEIDGKKILIDTCVGNHKSRKQR